jgi:hypothetical protein
MSISIPIGGGRSVRSSEGVNIPIRLPFLRGAESADTPVGRSITPDTWTVVRLVMRCSDRRGRGRATGPTRG